ncbi:MoaD/ThiS family protein [Gulosibacter molinativorax]|uniref:Molybdopterin synthase sulfur carrier subunit n=1 Tax=Gulosibacter molinativorax TaxID=256821 RepID=A0ABT7CB19_9MICO|nr:MoaD/ThiS family protein [Gulosibacter molinativorax]MDJ1372355.1 molybdopterin synthase sulfur carrier subunit [Gulosibacter molinativorax]QUY63555.1 Hypotetical protein [Gulosibacter molinativorax]
MREVRLFAAAADAAGVESIEVEADSVEGLREHLAMRFGPEFERILAQCSLLADGKKISSGPLTAGRVDILPPFAGG